MMSAELGIPVLYDQSFEGAAIAEGVGSASEEIRLRSAPVGVYEFLFRQPPRYDLSGAVFFNDTEPGSNGYDERKQFEVIEDLTGAERTLIIQSAGSGISLESVELIPLDWRRTPIDYTQLEASARRRMISYANNPPPEALAIRISGLNVFDVESITACLWAHGTDRIRFPAPQAAFIRCSEAIRVDQLNNPGASPRRLEEHLLALLDVFSNVLNERAFELDCRYQYQLTEGGLDVSAPVLNAVALDSESKGAILSEVAFGLTRWYREVSQKKGAFAFGVKFYSVRRVEPVPVLYLSQLILPYHSIAALVGGALHISGITLNNEMIY